MRQKSSATGHNANGRLPAILFVFLLTLGACAHPQLPDPELPGRHWMAQAAQSVQDVNQTQPTPYAPDKTMTFDECVFLAMIQAPSLTRSAIELEIARLHTDNAFWKQFPELRMQFSVTSNLTHNNDKTYDGYGETAYRVGFSVHAFNPVVDHYSHKAAEIMQEIAVLTHQKAIESLAGQIGEIFLRLEAVTAIQEKQAVLPDLARKAVAYWRTVEPGQEAGSIAYAKAQQQEKQAQAILNKTAAEAASLRQSLKLLLGLTPEQPLAVTTEPHGLLPAKEQTHSPSWEEVWQESTETRMAMLGRSLQDFNIMLAWSRYLPETGVDVFSANPTSGYAGNSNQDDTFAVLRLNIPLMDWGNRGRGVEEARLQKTMATEALQHQKSAFASKWAQARQNLELARAELVLAEQNLVIAGLEVKRVEIEFKSGHASFAQLLERQEQSVREEIKCVEARFNLRRLEFAQRVTNGELARRFFPLNQPNRNANQ